MFIAKAYGREFVADSADEAVSIMLEWEEENPDEVNENYVDLDELEIIQEF